MRDSGACRINKDDPEKQTGWCLYWFLTITEDCWRTFRPQTLMHFSRYKIS